MGKRCALLSVSDKTGIETLAKGLVEHDFEILSTGGTATALRRANIEVTQVSDLTGFPEIMDGRVKTLHPKVFAGILSVRNQSSHAAALDQHSIPRIDVVAVNLYPFEEQAYRSSAPIDDAMDLVDIGGPSLIRAAAKNHQDVVVLVDPSDYDPVLAQWAKAGAVDATFRKGLAAKAFAHTARYDAYICDYFHRFALGQDLPQALVLPLKRRQTLRYGENHHQRAAFYDDPLGMLGTEPGTAGHEQLHGKPLSYNNLLDADAALEALKEFDRPTVVIVKHVTPSGIASADNVAEAWEAAYATDTYSPFGGVVATNRPITKDAAHRLGKVFLELVAAPSFDADALDILQRKKNLRLLEIPGLEDAKAVNGYRIVSVTGGILVQERDTRAFDVSTWNIVTKRRPTRDEKESMLFAARCAKHVKSNSVVFAKGERTVGIGGGQTARVDASWIACHKGKANIRASVMASEAFFPFRDAVDVAAENGVVAIVQPGGSIRDQEVIEAADEHGIAMAFSGHRSFRH